jgi:urea transport system permease protein
MSTPNPTVIEPLVIEAPAGLEPFSSLPSSPPLPSSHRVSPPLAPETAQPGLVLPIAGPLLTRTGWSGFMAALIAVCALAPVLNLWVPEGSAFHMSTYAVALLGKIMCYAICALAMDLIWGYTGILSLGHGVFFALGGYVMGMYLMRQIGLEGNYKSELPDFMVFLDWKTLPWHWTFSNSFIATL